MSDGTSKNRLLATPIGGTSAKAPVAAERWVLLEKYIHSRCENKKHRGGYASNSET